MGRPTVAEIDLGALRYNFSQIRALAGSHREILAVVKADAYGHGAGPVARELQSAGAGLFGVATVEEGVDLRRGGVTLPVLILTGISPADLRKVTANNLTPVITDLESARALDSKAAKMGKTLSVHLKVDTGLSRLGIPFRDWGVVFEELRSLNHLRIEGLMSHLAAPESEREEDKSFTGEQIRRFQECLEHGCRAGLRPRYIHLAGSGAMATRNESCFNLVRPGLMLYGLHPSPALRSRISLRPVLSWKTTVLSLKRVCEGDTVSYGRTHYCRRESLIATLPVGYADGYSRGLSNKGEVLVRGKRAKVVGRVCMDLTMVDVSGIPGVKARDEVILLGKQGDEEISASEMAGWLGTISYEVLCAIGKRVPRVYKQG